MKTETQIAEENIKEISDCSQEDEKSGIYCKTCIQVREYSKMHKSSCQRFLEFLEALTKWGSWERMSIFAKQNVKDKITDLKQAIKLYEDAGI